MQDKYTRFKICNEYRTLLSTRYVPNIHRANQSTPTTTAWAAITQVGRVAAAEWTRTHKLLVVFVTKYLYM